MIEPELLAQLYSAGGLDAYAANVLAGLPRLIPSEITSYNQVDPRRSRIVWQVEPAGAEFAGANRPYLNGPAHSSGFTGWTMVNCPAGGGGPGICALLAPEGVPTDPNEQYFEIGADFGPAIGVLPVLTPATPGEYSLHPAPGIDSEVSVHQV